MGKSKRLKKNKRNQAEELSKMMQTGQGLEPLTDDLINQLARDKGIPLGDLKELQKDGAQYSASRNSFLYPTEMEWYD